MWSRLTTASLKQLARGRLSARVSFGGSHMIVGQINTFYSCGGFKSLITSLDALPRKESSAVATANFTLQPNGHLHYKVSKMSLLHLLFHSLQTSSTIHLLYHEFLISLPSCFLLFLSFMPGFSSLPSYLLSSITSVSLLFPPSFSCLHYPFP